MGYKLLGFAVWQGAKWYLRRRYPRLTDRRVLAAAVVLAAVGGLVARGAREDVPS